MGYQFLSFGLLSFSTSFYPRLYDSVSHWLMVVQSESLNASTPLELDAAVGDLQRKEKLDDLFLMADKGEEAITGTAEMGADGIR